MSEKPSAAFTGRCSCGAVSYRITQERPGRSYLCHCTDCRQSSGSSFAHNAVFESESLVIANSEGCLSMFGSEKDGSKRFCGRCGSPLFLTVPERNVDMKGQVIVCVGTMDGSETSEALKPVAEGWCRRREKWMGKAEGAQEFEEW